MAAKFYSERGFTLIELLVVMSIIGILSGISISSYSVYRMRAYDIQADDLLHTARVALTAGRGNTDELDTDFYWAFSDANGAFVGDDPNVFAPGISIGEDTRVTVWFNGFCENAVAAGWCAAGTDCCVLEAAVAYHCRGSVRKQQMIWNTGRVDQFEWANAGC